MVNYSYKRAKDNKLRRWAFRREIEKVSFFFLLESSHVDSSNKWRLNYYFMKKFNKILPYSVRAKNSCLLTVRSGSVIRYFKLSRLSMKHLASNGFLSGICKSSW